MLGKMEGCGAGDQRCGAREGDTDWPKISSSWVLFWMAWVLPGVITAVLVLVSLVFSPSFE